MLDKTQYKFLCMWSRRTVSEVVNWFQISYVAKHAQQARPLSLGMLQMLLSAGIFPSTKKKKKKKNPVLIPAIGV